MYRTTAHRTGSPKRRVTPTVLEWRARYYAFRHAHCRAVAGRHEDAAQIIAGPHGGYIRERFERLALRDDRFRLALRLARESTHSINQRHGAADDALCERLATLEADHRRRSAGRLHGDP